ncbi:MAG: C40 family peptidase [Steroidobacteraceae bacterium]
MRLIRTAAFCLILVACSSQPQHIEIQLPQGARIAGVALTQIGEPYRYGGDSPEGFDCSGLALFVHARAGVSIPRTAELQQRAAHAVKKVDMQAGDLVFFSIAKRRRVDHVGVYIGDGKFVHAPRAGSVVSIAYVEDPYFKRHFHSAGRF